MVIVDVNNEKAVMLVLSRWMSNFDIKIWWNQKNEHGYPVFNTKGRKRSDLLISTNNKYYVIECKHSEHKKNIYDAFFQLLDYSISETVYMVNKIPYNIDGYLLATEHSINGHLFNPKYDVLMTEKDFSENRMWAVRAGEIPRTEYSMTEAICRLLWRGVLKYNIEYPVGVLLSDKLNNPAAIKPLLLMKHGKWQSQKVIG